MNSFSVEGVITIMLVFSLTDASQENAETGKQYKFLMEEDYTQCYMKGHRARIKNLDLRTGNLMCCRAPCIPCTLIERTAISALSNHNCVCTA